MDVTDEDEHSDCSEDDQLNWWQAQCTANNYMKPSQLHLYSNSWVDVLNLIVANNNYPLFQHWGPFPRVYSSKSWGYALVPHWCYWEIHRREFASPQWRFVKPTMDYPPKSWVWVLMSMSRVLWGFTETLLSHWVWNWVLYIRHQFICNGNSHGWRLSLCFTWNNKLTRVSNWCMHYNVTASWLSNVQHAHRIHRTHLQTLTRLSTMVTAQTVWLYTMYAPSLGHPRYVPQP